MDPKLFREYGATARQDRSDSALPFFIDNRAMCCYTAAMKVTYRKTVSPELQLATVVIQSPLFARGVDITLSVYTFTRDKHTAITFGLQPSLEESIDMGLRGGFLRISEPDRCLEQRIDLPSIHGEILGLSELSLESGVEDARPICNAILRRFESVFESCRQHLLKNIASSARQKVAEWIHKIYGEYTKELTQNFLKKINWKFLFPDDCYGAEFINVIDFTLNNNAIRADNILAPKNDIPIINDQALVINTTHLAGLKAETLLERIIGSEGFNHFKTNGCFDFVAFGYRFSLAPRQFIKCTDPNNKTARLCIHTAGLSCHFLDEITIAFLNLRHDETFLPFMKTAIYHSVQSGFKKPWELTES